VNLARSPPRRSWPPLRQPRVNAPSAASASDREAKKCEHWNQQFPYPRGAPLRHPKAAEIEKRQKCDRPREQTNDEQDTERDLGHGLQRSRHGGVARSQAHDRLPRSRRVTLLDVVIDEARVACGTVEAFTQIFKEYRNKHSADRHPHDCQTMCCLLLVGYDSWFISHWGCASGHREPRNRWMLEFFEVAQVSAARERLSIAHAQAAILWDVGLLCVRFGRSPRFISSTNCVHRIVKI